MGPPAPEQVDSVPALAGRLSQVIWLCCVFVLRQDVTTDPWLAWNFLWRLGGGTED